MKVIKHATCQLRMCWIVGGSCSDMLKCSVLRQTERISMLDRHWIKLHPVWVLNFLLCLVRIKSLISFSSCHINFYTACDFRHTAPVSPVFKDQPVSALKAEFRSTQRLLSCSGTQQIKTISRWKSNFLRALSQGQVGNTQTRTLSFWLAHTALRSARLQITEQITLTSEPPH